MGKLGQAELVCIDEGRSYSPPPGEEPPGSLSSLYVLTVNGKLGQTEIVCIDEAAAIPLPLVKNLLGPYLVFMSSTVNG